MHKDYKEYLLELQNYKKTFDVDDIPKIFKQVKSFDAQVFLMKMLDCNWENLDEGSDDPLEGPSNGEFRISARELLEDKWLSD